MKAKKILFLDNDVMSYFLISYLLMGEEYEVVHCRFAKKALKLLRDDKSFALVITELVLPDTDGFTIIKKIREISPSIPVIAQTSHILIDIQSQCIKAGFDEFLSKPADIDHMMTLIKKHIQVTSSEKKGRRHHLPIF